MPFSKIPDDMLQIHPDVSACTPDKSLPSLPGDSSLQSSAGPGRIAHYSETRRCGGKCNGHEPARHISAPAIRY
ncbi:hypothetical protein PSACC_03616 [Paramicrosporidium saccamoebae]|uniref:Uncharacterized protein n=1 Tax=Paramicrosporidium saccamoebae TaxID=1246581 RepID=A0A2H9TFL6_9FUNG|nr:hypothetical protein PSACC_03616 [Paramicrosporidium saccamoebae]